MGYTNIIIHVNKAVVQKFKIESAYSLWTAASSRNKLWKNEFNWPVVLRQLHHHRTSLSCCCPRQRSLKMCRPQHWNDGSLSATPPEPETIHPDVIRWSTKFYKDGKHHQSHRRIRPIHSKKSKYDRSFKLGTAITKCRHYIANLIGDLILLCCLILLSQTLSKLGFKRFQEKTT